MHDKQQYQEGPQEEKPAGTAGRLLRWNTAKSGNKGCLEDNINSAVVSFGEVLFSEVKNDIVL